MSFTIAAFHITFFGTQPTFTCTAASPPSQPGVRALRKLWRCDAERTQVPPSTPLSTMATLAP